MKDGQGAIVEHITRVLDRLAKGSLMVLDAHFYRSRGMSFPQAMVVDPAGAYAEASRVLPESMIAMMFKLVLKSLGFSIIEVEGAVEQLRRGDSSAFLSLVSRAAHGPGKGV